MRHSAGCIVRALFAFAAAFAFAFALPACGGGTTHQRAEPTDETLTEAEREEAETQLDQPESPEEDDTDASRDPQ